MADTTFIAHQTTIDADWLNAVNDFYYTLFAGATTAAQARTAISAIGTTGATVTGAWDMTGATVTVPTAAPGDNDTSAASTAFVQTAVAGAIVAPSTSYVFARPPASLFSWPSNSFFPFTTKVTDTLSEYNAATGVFTPVDTGVYLFTVIADAASASTYSARIVIGSAEYFLQTLTTSVPNQAFLSASITLPITSGSTATILGNGTGAGAGYASPVTYSHLSIKRLL